MKHIAILGGCGFIGTNIALEAINRGYKVTIFDSLIRKDSEENLYKTGATYLRGDVRSQDDLDRLPPDISHIINLAANPGIPWSIQWPRYDFEVNAGGAVNVLEYAREHGNIPVIFASTNKCYSNEVNELPMEEGLTRYVWADRKYQGIPETFGVDGRGMYSHSPYGVSKIAADLYHQEYYQAYNLPVIINRMSCIYGYYQKGVADQGWADHFVKTIVKGDGKLDIFGNGKQVRDMLFGSDVAKLYLEEVEKVYELAGSVFNVGGGMKYNVSLLEAVNFICETTGKKAQLKHHNERHADQRIYISDIRKVTHTLDWEPTTSPFEGLQKMINVL